MRTMKKVIALSLVLAMALSMMATAAFKDQEAINEDLTGDISLMVALNVFSEQGTGAGYFEPNRELTREEVAKLIYVLKNKGVDNGATSWTGMNIFKDIESGRWSEGYINYAASVGMMAGTGEGYFNPTAKMSAVEVAKLLLVLNGYKADVQGYLGTNWDVNIIRDAEAAGIFANYDLPVRGSVTREWVARLMNNGIAVTKVKYEDGQAVEMYNQVCMVGSLTKTRGITETILAGRKTGCVLALAGKFAPAEYESQLRAMPEFSCVDYKGVLPLPQVTKLLQESMLGVCLLLDVGQYWLLDNLPTKVGEYMSMGLPTVIHGSPFNRRFIEEYHCGICVDPTNVQEVADAIRYLLDHPEEARQMGENGRRAVKERFNWGVEAAKLLKLYQELLAN